MDKFSLKVIICTALFISINSCSVYVPLKINEIADRKEQIKVTDYHSIEEIPRNIQIEMVLNDSTKMNCKYLGLKKISEKNYIKKYQIFCEQNAECSMPKYNYLIEMKSDSIEKVRGYFKGFDVDSQIRMLVFDESYKIKMFDIGRFDRISMNEHYFDMEKILKLLSSHKVPLYSMAKIKHEKRVCEINPECIVKAKKIKKNRPPVIGKILFGVSYGLIMDAYFSYYIYQVSKII